MEDDLDAVPTVVKQLAPAKGIHNGVGGVVDDIVGSNGRKGRGILREDTSLELDDVILGQQIGAVGNVAPKTLFVHPLPDVLLNLVDGIF